MMDRIPCHDIHGGDAGIRYTLLLQDFHSLIFSSWKSCEPSSDMFIINPPLMLRQT